MGEALVNIATAVRRYKSEANISLGTELACLQLAPPTPSLHETLQAATTDLMSITRAARVELVDRLNPAYISLPAEGNMQVAILP
ncbi:MAG: hypothetical protein EXR62_09725 [Chloroflexi bacterium]|nr:hypothetical protein [Chloroflexota bacterium]